jgi:hypothetical protein
MPRKKNLRFLLFALVGMSYLAGISQIEGIPVFLTGFIALLPVQLGILGYLWLSGYLIPARSR